MSTYATCEEELPPTQGPAGTSALQGFVASAGGWRLEQRIIGFPPGRTSVEADPDREEVIGVLRGSGAIELSDGAHVLDPWAGAYVGPGEDYAVDSPAGDLVVMSVKMLPGPTPEGWVRRSVARWAEQEPHRAGKDREFRLLACSRAATVFVGTIPVGRARDHYHHYEEVAYVLEGTGVMHMDGQPDVEIRPGLCVHFAPRVPHCLENTGEAPLRLLGVFTPPVSPGEAFNMDGR